MERLVAKYKESNLIVLILIGMVLVSVVQELVFLKQHSEQKQKQTSLVSRQFFVVVFVHLCRLVSKHFARLVMIQETHTSSVSMR
jgi:hypothetical protein